MLEITHFEGGAWGKTIAIPGCQIEARRIVDPVMYVAKEKGKDSLHAYGCLSFKQTGRYESAHRFHFITNLYTVDPKIPSCIFVDAKGIILAHYYSEKLWIFKNNLIISIRNFSIIRYVLNNAFEAMGLLIGRMPSNRSYESSIMWMMMDLNEKGHVIKSIKTVDFSTEIKNYDIKEWR
jgi:hypothetical protein